MNGPRRAAVLGSPIAHSRSPQLHLAAYHALGLTDWTYQRIGCTADELPARVGGFGPEWVGVSVTMPDKFAALHFADERTARAELVGSANTLVRTSTGWSADNTDIDGVIGALGTVRPTTGMVLGSGGTAPAALMGLAAVGAQRIIVVARNPARADQLLELAKTIGVDGVFCAIDDPDLAEVVADTDVVVSTVPADAAAPYASSLAGAPLLLDAIYDPWPTPLAAAVSQAGGRVISGLQMLLHQAFTQVELFTGRPAPHDVMAAVLG